MRIALPIVLGLSLAVGARGQQVRTVRLDKPLASHSAEWTVVAGVRELADGRLVVLDAREQAIKVADLKTGAAATIGRKGSGPGEYQVPGRMFTLPGDSSIVVDVFNAGRPVLIAGGVGSRNGLPLPAANDPAPFLTIHGQVDHRGFIYRQSPISGDDNLRAIERMSRATGRIDTAAYVSGNVRFCSPPDRGTTPGKPPTTPPPKFARAAPPRAWVTVEQWVVAEDGTVALVCPDPYRVTFVSPAGRTTSGSISFDPIPVTDKEKQAWLADLAEPVAVMRYGTGGQRSVGFQKSPMAREPAEWPSHMPPFEMARGFRWGMLFAPDGRLWVSRLVATGAPSQYDVVGRDAKLAYRVELPPRSRVVGFGRNSVYVVTLDEDDIERLSRFSFPAVTNR